MASEVFRAAAVQARPVFLDRDATIEKGVALIEEAGRNGAKLIAFPETWVPGYPAWIYGAAGWDDAASKKLFARLQSNAVEVPSPATDALCLAARQAGAHVVVGINERDNFYSTGTIYNSLLYISDKGEILGVHRKIMPTHAERILWGQGDGSTFHVFDTAVGRLGTGSLETSVGRVGGLICWEHWMPLARFAMHAKGEQIHVAAWPDVPEAHAMASRTYAFEGRCYVVCVGSILSVDDMPDDFDAHEQLRAAGEFAQRPEGILTGGSGIIGPDGNWVAGPVVGEETIVYGDIDLSRIAEEQQALDVVGHYNRPDIFELRVDERSKQQVSWLRDARAERVEVVEQQ